MAKKNLRHSSMIGMACAIQSQAKLIANFPTITAEEKKVAEQIIRDSIYLENRLREPRPVS